jgi:hypothetical protein
METTTQGAISLHFIDTKLNKKTPLRIAIIPSKCFIENDIPVIYCGIPYGAPEGVILPDDYLKGIFSSRDRIVKIDFKAPKITELWNGASEAIDIRNPARIGTELFFMSGEDESVWSIKL